jgi:hypothetical protein
MGNVEFRLSCGSHDLGSFFLAKHDINILNIEWNVLDKIDRYPWRSSITRGTDTKKQDILYLNAEGRWEKLEMEADVQRMLVVYKKKKITLAIV